MKQASSKNLPLRLVPAFFVVVLLLAGVAFAARRKEIGTANIVSGDEQLDATLITVAPNTIYGGDESRVEIRDRGGNLLALKDFTSADSSLSGQVGDWGWTPDSQFFVFSIVSSGGHDPGRWRVWYYSRARREFEQLDALLDGRPVIQQGIPFQIIAPHSVRVTTWAKSTPKHPITVAVDLAAPARTATSTLVQ